MTRTFLLACLLVTAGRYPLTAQNSTGHPATSSIPQAQPAQTKPAAPDEENPPEEDESVAPEKYVLNPLESARNIKVGNYYWRKGKFRAAAERYQRATRYNPSSPEAFFKLGEAEQKLKHTDAARMCFQKVMQLAPESRLAEEARKKAGSKG